MSVGSATAVLGWLVLAEGIGAVTAPDLRLLRAAKDRDRAAIRELLQKHVPVDAAEADGSTALDWAAHWDDLETADLLVRAGTNVNAATTLGVTPLSLACENGS